MRLLLIALLGVVLACPLAAQIPRETVLVGNPAGEAQGVAIDSYGDLCAILYKDGADQSIRLVRADGRALFFAAVPRIDAGTGQLKEIFPDSLAIAGNSIYVYWLDHRQAEVNVYFNRSVNAGLNWQPTDMKISKGFQLDDVKDVRMLVDERSLANPNDDLIVFLTVVHRATLGLDEILINYSLNSGVSFQPLAIPFSLHNGLADVDQIALQLEGNLIYGFWQDNFGDPVGDTDDIWFSKFDVDTGTFLLQDQLVNFITAPFMDVDAEFALDVDGNRIALLWQQDVLLGGAKQLMGIVSIDGGMSWQGEQLVGQYTAGVHDTDFPDVALTPTGNIIAVWEDNRTGLDQVYTARSTDFGLTWSLDQMLSTAGGQVPHVIAKETTVLASWCSGSFPNFCEASWSMDDCSSWGTPIVVSDNVGDTDAPAVTFNPFYTNFVMAWAADDLGLNNVYCSGFRRQTLFPMGNWYTPGSPIHFEVANWPEAEYGWPFGVLISATPGDFFLANGMNLGLKRDRFFNRSFDMILSGLLRGTIDSTGYGATPVITAPVIMPPATLYATAVAFQNKLILGCVTEYLPLL